MQRAPTPEDASALYCCASEIGAYLSALAESEVVEIGGLDHPQSAQGITSHHCHGCDLATCEPRFGKLRHQLVGSCLGRADQDLLIARYIEGVAFFA
jgi:hypothetical protein